MAKISKNFTKSLNEAHLLPKKDRFKIFKIWRTDYVAKLKKKYNFSKIKTQI